MTVKIVTSWYALFQYAHRCGQSRLAYNDDPSAENKAALERAIQEHDDYRDICLKADRMVGLEGLI